MHSAIILICLPGDRRPRSLPLDPPYTGHYKKGSDEAYIEGGRARQASVIEADMSGGESWDVSELCSSLAIMTDCQASTIKPTQKKSEKVTWSQ